MSSKKKYHCSFPVIGHLSMIEALRKNFIEVTMCQGMQIATANFPTIQERDKFAKVLGKKALVVY